MPDDGILEPAASPDSVRQDPRGKADDGDAILDAALAQLDLGVDEDPGDEPRTAAVERHPTRAKAEPKASADEDDDDAEPDDEPEGDEEESEETGAELAESDEGDESDEEEDDDDDEVDEDEAEIELHRAYTLLHDKLGVPASVLKSTSRSKLIAWAQRVEEKAVESAEASPKNERGRDASAGANADGDSPAQEKAESGWATMRAGIAEKLGIDEDAAEALRPLHDTNESLRAELTELRSLVERQNLESRAREGRATIDRELKRLERPYPGLRSDSEKSEEVVEAAADMIAGARKRGQSITAHDAFNKAARAVLGRARRSDMAQLRRNGASTPPDRIGSGRNGDVTDEKGYWGRAMDLAYSGRPDQIARMPYPSPKKPRGQN